MSPDLKQVLEYCAELVAVVVTFGTVFYIGDVFEALAARIRGRRK